MNSLPVTLKHDLIKNGVIRVNNGRFDRDVKIISGFIDYCKMHINSRSTLNTAFYKLDIKYDIPIELSEDELEKFWAKEFNKLNNEWRNDEKRKSFFSDDEIISQFSVHGKVLNFLDYYLLLYKTKKFDELVVRFQNSSFFSGWLHIESLRRKLDFIKKQQVKKGYQYADKWYALYHAIAVATGIENAPTFSGKDATVEFGKRKYNTKGEGFYKAWRYIDLTKTYTYVRSLNEKDRNRWKKIITDISNNNADIIHWLSKQPN